MPRQRIARGRHPMTRFLMVWGTSSGAGKSWLATALCSIAVRRGLRVRPFKAQNMSNNARVVAGPHGHGAEIGAAQYFQALAARVEPTVDMNPVLLKPEHETASQVVVHGRVDAALSRQGWRERSAALAEAAYASLARVSRDADLVVIEGAGSPAEINLAAEDFVNLGTVRRARTMGEVASVLVADIDRGGAFAHLHGTWSLLPEDLRPTLQGFVLNRFRGDPALLAPGPEDLLRLTGVPVAGVIPYFRRHGLPDEDGLDPRAVSGIALQAATGLDLQPIPAADSQAGPPPVGDHPAPRPHLRVAILYPPHISNLDEFAPLQQVAGLELVWARTPGELRGADWIILPGSKQVSGDLAWLRRQGLDAAIAQHAADGGAVLGVCGGLQMLGEALVDPDGHDGEPGFDGPGLGLLPLVTRYEADKRVRRGRMTFAGMTGAWAGLSRVAADGYEIHCGTTVAHPAMAAPHVALRDETGAPLGWQSGNVLGVYAHGLFESDAVLRALWGASARPLDDTLDGVADFAERHLDSAQLDRWLRGGG
jgi:adenosylcobyric acid synthase